MRNIIVSILGLLLIIGAIYLGDTIANSKNKTRAIPEKVIKTVFVDTVQNGTVQIVIPANGSLMSKHRVELYSEVQGVFKSSGKLFKPGQEYRKGETLIRIDASEYYASVQSSKSNLYNSIAAIMPDLRLDFPEVFPKWQNYLKDFDLEKTTPKLPEMATEKENYFITGRGIISSYYNVKNLEQRLSKYNIRAPFTGILTTALVTEGSLIRNGQKLGEYIDPSIYEMEVALSKTYARLLKVGESVVLNSMDGLETYKGTVSRVNGSIDAATQTITAFIEVKNESLKEGMYLEASLNAKEEYDVIEINRNLILDTKQVFIVRDSILDLMAVTPIYYSDTKVVLRDIPNGTVIVSKPVSGAYAGMLVKPYISKSQTDDRSGKSEEDPELKKVE